MKKALINTLINEFLISHKLVTIQQIIDSAPELYKFLKTHPNKPLPESITYGNLEQEMMSGLQKAQMMGMFRR